MLEDGVALSHLRECFNPGIRTQFTTTPNEQPSQPCPAISWMQDNTRECHQLTIEQAKGGSTPAPALSEKLVPLCQCFRRGNEQTDSNRFLPVPQNVNIANQPDVVTPVMPPSEVRPVRFGPCRDPAFVGKACSFFLRSVDGEDVCSICPFRWHLRCWSA